MILPQEIEVYYVIPAIRRELAKALVSKGLKQKQVAALFGVTEACISNYFKSKRGQDVKFSKNELKLIKEGVNNLLNGKSCFINTVQKVCKSFRKNECLCELHKKLDNHTCGYKGCLV